MELEKFCFCCKLQKGAFIWSIISTIFYFILLITTTIASDSFVDKKTTENVTGVSISQSDNSYETYKSSLHWAILVSSIIHLISSILLCIGVRKVCFLKLKIFIKMMQENSTEKSLHHVAMDYY